MSDEAELDRLNWNEETTGRAEAARNDPSRNPQPSDPQPSDELPLSSPVVGSTAVDVGVGADDNDGIPFGQVAEDPDDDDEMMEEADEPPHLVDPSDDEAGPAAPYEPESESDNDEDGGVAPTAKRAHAGGAEPTAKRARELHALQQFPASAEVKRILKELEEYAELKLPADRNRQAPRAASQRASRLEAPESLKV